jgi:hypothetical protein
MNGTKKTILQVSIALLWVSCAAGPHIGRSPYRPREQSGDGYGYSQTQINSRVFEVYFAGVSEGDAHEGGMRRAAELTLDVGFDGFVIISRQDRNETRVRSRFIVGRVRRNVPVSIVTISMLSRTEFNNAPSMVYDARTLMRTAGAGSL